MDIDEHTPVVVPNSAHRTSYVLQPTNTLAGPSTPPTSLFLPPPDPPRPSPHFRSTDDLLTRFQLLSAYDRYVRPYATPAASASLDKGKGKERELPQKDPSTPAPLPPPGQLNDPEEEDGTGKGEKRLKNNYRHLIKGIPGKHSMKKDDYLMTTMQIPPKQRIAITPFDLRTQREAFSVSLEGLKGWNINVLVAESPQAREDRKKRKEMKRLAKAQQMAGMTPGTAPAAVTPIPTTVGTPGASGHPPVGRSNTPRPGSAPAARPAATQSSSQPRGTTPAGVGTPRSVSTPGVSGAVSLGANTPVPGSTSAPAQMNVQGNVPIPSGVTAGGGGVQEVKRGVKREREDSVNGVVSGNGQPVDSTSGKPHGVTTGVKAGMNGIRPRPVKKQRVDGGPLPIQQPTPHA
ncbi:hypothetical protein BXZ70DRAFT_1010306 [Cristinia sonorae]|uniref:Mediator of RNA polymerase II transcription subunit 19 n=1 Tax=Cristinia sonorae TaxID=1940300 RepID=A0A8K0UJT9_9AGAR|nr:hypothetical protein BXZ70DRAFT_1010306 [Cristinia sonorae]